MRFRIRILIFIFINALILLQIFISQADGFKVPGKVSVSNFRM